MRRMLVSIVVVGAVLLSIGGAVLSTLRAEARGPLAVQSGDLLDAGSVVGLHVLVSAGGEVRTLLPNGAVVSTRHGRAQEITYVKGARFFQRLDARHDIPVGRSAVEPHAHLTALGLRSAPRFYAYKVRISPHRRAIGGRIDHTIGRDVLEISNRRGAFFVRLRAATVVRTRHQPFRGTLTVGMHVATLAVPDPADPVGGELYLAATVDVLPTPVTARAGGIITAIDAACNFITIYNKAQDRRYTLEVTRTTKITLNKWASGYGDMILGDHVTVSGVLDQLHSAIGPNPILARRIRIGSPSFSGVISAIAPAPAPPGSLTLTVRARRGHMLRITAPGKATVVYGQLPARVLDLLVGEKIAVHGLRTDKFALTASLIRVYPRQRTVGGVVAHVIAGGFRIVNPTDNAVFIIHTMTITKYSLGSHTAPASGIAAGTHIRVRGYDALHNDQKPIPVIIASHISIIVHKATHHTRRRKPTKPTSVSTPTPTPKPTTTAATLRIRAERQARPRLA